jgi:uncharacterized protein (TIRG00374 family)
LNTSKSRLKRIAIGLNLVLIVLLIAGFAYYGNLEAMLSILGAADWRWFVLAVAVGLFSSFVTSTRLWLLIRKQEIRIALGELFAINLGVRFYSFFSPFSSVGTIMRWIRLVPAGQAAGGFAALAANRFFEVVVPLSMGALWALSSVSLDILSPWVILIYLLGLLLVVWAALRSSGDLSRRIAQVRERSSSQVIGTALRALEKLLASLERYRTLSGREVMGLIGLALAGDIIGLLGHVLIARSIDLPIAFTDIGWIRAIMLLVAMAPFTLPGGFGLREVSTIVLVTALGVDVGHATAYSILLYSRMVVTALVGGAVELLFNLRTFRAGFTT